MREAAKLAPFWIIVMVISFSTMPASALATYYKTFGLSFIGNDQFLAAVGSISNLFNSFGRLFWGVVVDRLSAKVDDFFMQFIRQINLNSKK